jgi:RNA polymerase primary sigma factor
MGNRVSTQRTSSAGGQPDTGVGAFIRDLGRIELLDRAAEIALSKKMILHLDLLRKTLLSNDYCLRSVTNLFEKISLKPECVRSYIGCRSGDARKIVSIIQRNLGELKDIVRENKKALRRVVSKRAFEEEKTRRPELTRKEFRDELLGQIQQRRDRARHLLDQTPVKQSTVLSLSKRLETLAESMKTCRASLKTAVKKRDLHECQTSSAELRTLIYRLGDVASGLKKTVRHAHVHKRHWGKARDEMILKNNPLVISIARKMSHKSVDPLDLIQVGNLALMRAVDSFDPSKGLKLSTYATRVIQRSFKRYIRENQEVVKRSEYGGALSAKVGAIITELGHRLGMSPSKEAIVDELNAQKERSEPGELIFRRKTPFQERDIVMLIPRQIVSFSDRKKGDPALELANTPEDDAVRREGEDILRTLLSTLDETSQKIITMRAGLETGEKMTIKEIGQALGCTVNHVRYLKQKACNALQKLCDSLAIQPPV